MELIDYSILHTPITYHPQYYCNEYLHVSNKSNGMLILKKGIVNKVDFRKCWFYLWPNNRMFGIWLLDTDDHQWISRVRTKMVKFFMGRSLFACLTHFLVPFTTTYQ